MKKSILIVCLIIIMTVGLLLGCTRVSLDAENGFTTTRNYDFTDFTSIEIGYAFELEVIPADTYSISINASESTFDRIEVTKSGDKLKIGIDSLLFHSYRSPRAKITMPEVKGLYISGASEGNVSGFSSSHDFELTLSGASELDTSTKTRIV